MTGLLITSSRTWRDEATARHWLGQAYQALGSDRRTTLLSGNAQGGDQLLERLREEQGLFVLRFKANWTQPCRGGCTPGHRKLNGAQLSYCPAAGMYRNQDMVDHLARQIRDHGSVGMCLELRDLCSKPRCRKTPKIHWSHGAEGCADAAEAAGITTWRVPA